ncbi:hypothetical protein N9Z02_00595 [Akkermansiaceae bacterium]|nr:hypothetical protein [Akkermansiaceae bacterium]
MSTLFSSLTFLTGACLIGPFVAAQEAHAVDVATLERENRALHLQIEKLNEGYASVLVREAAKTKSLKNIKERLALFGKGLFEGGDDSRMLSAVADYQVTREQLTKLELSSMDLVTTMQDYLRTVVASDPEARSLVEAKMRQLQVDLGQRQQPKRQLEQGTAAEAKVVSVDSESGLLIINAGENAEVRPGMRFRIERSGNHLGDAVVAASRADVSGLLIQSLNNPENPVLPKDTAIIILDNSEQSN